MTQSALQYDPLMSDALDFYARRALAGDIVVGPLVAEAMERHYSYLEASKDPEAFPYVYRPEFGQMLRQWAAAKVKWVRGDLEGEPAHLLPWQAAFWDYVVGWHRLERDGEDWRMLPQRMVSTAYQFVPKGSGKTQGTNVALLYLAATSRSARSDFFILAPALNDQANETIEHAAVMAEAMGGFSVRRKEGVIIKHDSTGCRLRAAGETGRAGKKDGFRAEAGVVDEFGAIIDPVAVKQLRSGGKATEDQLLIFTSTAAEHASGFGWETFLAARGQVEPGRHQRPDFEDDPGIFSFLCTVDDDHRAIALEWTRKPSDRAWTATCSDSARQERVQRALKGRKPQAALLDAIKMASPSLKVREGDPGTVLAHNWVEEITNGWSRGGLDQVIEALRAALNLWRGVDGQWLSIRRWESMKLEGEPPAPGGRVAYGAFATSGQRFAALVVVHLDAEPVHVEARVYVAPQALDTMAKADRRGATYDRWVKSGDVTLDGSGSHMTLAPMVEDLETIHGRHHVVAGMYSDAVLPGGLARVIERNRWRNITRAALTAAKYDPGASELERRFDAGTLTHDGNAALTEAVERLGVKRAKDSGVMVPVKHQRSDRTAPGYAMVLAFSAAVNHMHGRAPSGPRRSRRGSAPAGRRLAANDGMPSRGPVGLPRSRRMP